MLPLLLRTQAKCRYVTQSGRDRWIFLQYHKDTKKFGGYYSAKVHPCYGNGNDPEIVSTPFSMSKMTSNIETILLDGTANTILEKESKQTGKSIKQILKSQYEIDMTEKDKFYPRDMDGRNKLFKKSELYTVRRIRLKEDV